MSDDSPARALPDDAALLARLRAGDMIAFEQLVKEAGPRMLSVARRMLVIEEDAQDAVQEAFLSAFRNLAKFDGWCRVTTWLHSITVNECLMRLRTRRRKPERLLEDLLPRYLPDGHQVKSTVAWPEAATEGEPSCRLHSAVRTRLSELPEQYRMVLVLRDVEQLSTEQAAFALGLSENAVKMRLHRARQALRTLLEGEVHQGRNTE
jgi:RNA polymerase sigma-70 factor (ECF subfamily)